MKRFTTIGLALAALLVTLAQEAQAYVDYPWCVMGARRSMECIFTTREQCAEDGTRGFGGTCIENPFYHRPPEGSARRQAQSKAVDRIRRVGNASASAQPSTPIIYRFNRYQGTDPDEYIRSQLQRDGRNYPH